MGNGGRRGKRRERRVTRESDPRPTYSWDGASRTEGSRCSVSLAGGLYPPPDGVKQRQQDPRGRFPAASRLSHDRLSVTTVLFPAVSRHRPEALGGSVSRLFHETEGR